MIELMDVIQLDYPPKTVYLLLTTSPEDRENDETEETQEWMRQEIEKEKETEDRLWTLLDLAEKNLQSNGFNLMGVYA